MKEKTALLKTFQIPVIVFLGIILYIILSFLHQETISVLVILIVTILGSFRLFKESLNSILKRQFALDYIAILAILVSLVTHEYIVAGILALMIASGRTLEDYGVAQAKKSLTKLIDRIPNEVTLWKNNKIDTRLNIGKIKIGDEIVIRKGEVIGLDGILASETGLTDESSLTGEPYTIDKIKGDFIRSGTINIGNPIVVKVTKLQADSTYNKIIDMVKRAQVEKSPFIRLADRYSAIFTIITLFITAFAYILSGFDLTRALSVLVIATPCPLIIATPIALLGGVSSSSKKHIIVKKLSSLEKLARAQVLIFDKTGTITLGRPKVTEFKKLSKDYTDEQILTIAQAIERNSLHPLAKAIVEFSRERRAPTLHAEKIEEKIGVGISGAIAGKRYSLSKLPTDDGMAIGIFKNERQIGIFRFEDEIKPQAKAIIKNLEKENFELFIFTGDKKEAAERVALSLGGVRVQAECTPEDKQKGIEKLKKEGKITAMVGDGINDAPALALSDVGMVFSNEEQTAASEAADIVFLGGDFSMVNESLKIAKRTISIAVQSILWGIGISIVGMIAASFGLIPPIGGAFLQEGIDVAVIINALRASRIN
ncbi:MAG: cadmium-translocating P-type ATPase [Patescibacteria group bacterium]|nr:cadmium-translocating P-type ATPase [Patescibacteria group bacterium]